MSTPRTIALPYTDAFKGTLGGLPGSRLPWLADLRTTALSHVLDSGLPSPKVEEWRYTNLNTLAAMNLRPAESADADPRIDTGVIPDVQNAYRLVFVNGRMRADLSAIDGLPPGVVLSPLAKAFESQTGLLESHLGRLARPNGHAILNLNTAFMTDGTVLSLAEGTVVDRPIHLVFIGAPAAELDEAVLALHPRNLVIAEPGSRASIIESHVGGAGNPVYWSNPVCEISVGRDARISHTKIQDESPAATHLAYLWVRIDTGGVYDSFVMSTGAALSRNEIQVVLDGERASCRLNGIYLMRGVQHTDTTTWIDHAKPHCDSDEVYKGVLDDRARGVFQGKITVRQDAQKTNGNQLSRAILLSDGAEINTKPELEIFADDVKCSHGATAGELEEDALFYLRSRGIRDFEARTLLIRAFIGELLEDVATPSIRTWMEARVDDWLSRGRTEGEPA